jgi:hypothetical protein
MTCASGFFFFVKDRTVFLNSLAGSNEILHRHFNYQLCRPHYSKLRHSTEYFRRLRKRGTECQLTAADHAAITRAGLSSSRRT